MLGVHPKTAVAKAVGRFGRFYFVVDWGCWRMDEFNLRLYRIAYFLGAGVSGWLERGKERQSGSRGGE